MCEQLDRKSTKHANQSKRSNFVSYFLKSSAGIRTQVCKDFFLATLGYTRKSSVIHAMLKSTPREALTATPDARGGLRDGHQKDKESIKAHIVLSPSTAALS